MPNGVTASGPSRGVISEFQRFRRLTELIQYAQDHELVSIRHEQRENVVGGPIPAASVTAAAVVDAAKAEMEYRPNGDGKTWSLLRKENKTVPAGQPAGRELARARRAARRHEPQAGRVLLRRDRLAWGSSRPLALPRPRTSVLHITPRSSVQVYFYLSNGVEVPCEHFEQGLVRPTTDAGEKPMDSRELTRGLFEVHSCKGHKPPPTAYVAIKSRGYWFYIDDRDNASKATFALVLSLSRLDFGNQKPSGPILTLPGGTLKLKEGSILLNATHSRSPSFRRSASECRPRRSASSERPDAMLGTQSVLEYIPTGTVGTSSKTGGFHPPTNVIRVVHRPVTIGKKKHGPRIRQRGDSHYPR